MRFTVSGLGWVTPFGFGSGRPGSTKAELRVEGVGIPNAKDRVGDPFPPSNRGQDARDTSGAILRLGSGPLPALKSSHFLETPHPRFGRFDSYTKAGFGAIALALRSAGLDRWTQKRDFGLVVGTRLGCLEADIAYFQTAACDAGTLASPNLFAYTLSSTMLGEASIQFGLTGASFVVDDAAGHLAGVHAALDLLAWGLCETVVAGWCDVGEKVECPLFRSDAQEPCGAVFFVLTKGPEAAPWHWEGRELTNGTQRIADLATLAQKVLELPR